MKTKKKPYIKKKDVRIGGIYVAKISGKLAVILITAARALKAEALRESPRNGWFARNLQTGKNVTIKSHMKLRLDLNSIPGIAIHAFDETQTDTGATGNRDESQEQAGSGDDSKGLGEACRI